MIDIEKMNAEIDAQRKLDNEALTAFMHKYPWLQIHASALVWFEAVRYARSTKLEHCAVPFMETKTPCNECKLAGYCIGAAT
jgi:hypothetical protein